MFDLGIQELVVIFVVALIVFGPKRLPELGKTLGKGILELKKAMEGVKEQMSTESDRIDMEAEGAPVSEEKKDEAMPEAPATHGPEEDFYVSEKGDESATGTGTAGTEKTSSMQEKKPSEEKGNQGR
ncbi:MAG: twin-arginine translocase TatA/TatE family subunit [Nitrospirae bacterium]|nr:twin-arginine translocase TatA/TatE family subunit [Nitrospirota bacterium]